MAVRSAKWIGAAVLPIAIAAGGVAIHFAHSRKAARKVPPPDARRLALRTEAYHYCEFRLIAALPAQTRLNVRAFNRGRRSSTEIGRDTFRVVGFFEGEVFGYTSRGEYQCVIRHPEVKDYQLIEMRMRRDLPDPYEKRIRPVRPPQTEIP